MNNEKIVIPKCIQAKMIEFFLRTSIPKMIKV